MKVINNIIDDNVNKVDFKFKKVDSTVFGVSMTAYGTLLLQGIFIVFVIVVWRNVAQIGNVAHEKTP